MGILLVVSPSRTRVALPEAKDPAQRAQQARRQHQDGTHPASRHDEHTHCVAVAHTALFWVLAGIHSADQIQRHQSTRGTKKLEGQIGIGDRSRADRGVRGHGGRGRCCAQRRHRSRHVSIATARDSYIHNSSLRPSKSSTSLPPLLSLMQHRVPVVHQGDERGGVRGASRSDCFP